jgi:flagellar biogenesis protein FliO
MGVPGSDLPGLGSSLALSLVSLGLVCLVAFVVLRWLARRWDGRGQDCVRILGRCGLEPRRALYLIETGGRCFLIGVGDGPMTMLAELDRATVAIEPPACRTAHSTAAFAQVLEKVFKRERR